MTVQLVKWGNSQGIIIPKTAVEDSGFRLNEPLQLSVQNGKITLYKQFRHRTLEERAAEFGDTLGEVQEFDWGGPEGREIW